MINEWAIFTDDGQIEAAFFTEESAVAAMATYTKADPNNYYYVGACCPDHPDEEHGHCQECDGDE